LKLNLIHARVTKVYRTLTNWAGHRTAGLCRRWYICNL